MERTKYQQSALTWIMEMELLNHPQLINQIKMNVLMVSRRIKEVELLIYRENKTMLVLLELSWLGKKFFKRRIFAEVEEILSQMLPSFRFRVTDDPKIMDMAVARVKHALTGGKNEVLNNPSVNVSLHGSESSTGGEVAQAAPGAVSNSESDLEKQSRPSSSLSNDAGQSDLRQKSKV